MRAFEYLSTPARQLAALGQREHRPWRVPRRPWLMAQTWESLLFAHWPFAPERLRARVPAALELDSFDGKAWLGITPFKLSGLRLELTPPLPRLSTFPEINVRTYVTVAGKPGIYFFSLDAGNAIAVSAARRVYRLPYFLAEMLIEREQGDTVFASARVDRRGPAASFVARYRPNGPHDTVVPGSLEYFLTERYCLYAVDGGHVFRGEIHHRPWKLRAVGAEITTNTMPPPGLDLPATEPLLHFAERQDVLIWSLDRVA